MDHAADFGPRSMHRAVTDTAALRHGGCAVVKRAVHHWACAVMPDAADTVTALRVPRAWACRTAA